MVTLDKPVAVDRSNATAAVNVADTVSMFANVVGVTAVLRTATSSSVPAPPSSLSPEFRVCRDVVDKPASNVSSPLAPVNVFVPVVSDLWQGLRKYL